MKYPGLSTYKLNVQQKFEEVIKAKIFAGGNVFSRVPFTGNRSIVFPVLTGNAKFALRCWHKDPGNIGVRYRTAKSYIETIKLPYFTAFDYIDEGIEIDSVKYPISYLEWIDGQPLGKFIEECVKNNQQTKIAEIAEKFRTMMQQLHEYKIAHGDLQEGNMIVCPDGSLKLIDYDCLYVPTLKNVPGLNKLQGVLSYQPPGNRQSDETADYFSALVIYLSLLVYARNPALWTPKQEMQMLFVKEDFLNPYTSATFHKLINGDYPAQILFLAKELQKTCQSPQNNLLPLERVIKKVNANVEVAFQMVKPVTDRAVRQPISVSSQDPALNDAVKNLTEMFAPPVSAPIVPATNAAQPPRPQIVPQPSKPSSVPSKSTYVPSKPLTKAPQPRPFVWGAAIAGALILIALIIAGGFGLWLYFK